MEYRLFLMMHKNFKKRDYSVDFMHWWINCKFFSFSKNW